MSSPRSASLASRTRHDVFVASSAEDRAWVHGYLLDVLSQAGISYCDESSFELGVPRLTSMERAVQESDRTVAVFSRAFSASDDNDFLVALVQAWGSETGSWPLIPVLYQDVPVPPRIRMLNVLDLRDEATWEAGIEQLVETLGRPIGRSRPPPSCPYPGMRPYAEEEAEDFVGRDTEIAALIDRLCRSRLQCLVGPSGSGKSSLVLAGLAPRLGGHAAFDGDAWRTHAIRPGSEPLRRIAASFGLERTSATSELVEHVAASAVEARRLLVVDQAEELFALAPVDVEEFTELLTALQEVRRVRVLLTVRADFYGQLMESPLWPLVERHQFRVLPLGDDGLRAALVKPAERVGVYVEPALVERLIRDASGETGMLPFLQVTMRMLWHRIERRLLTLSGYEALVLSEATYGTGNGLVIAMSRHADGVLDRLDAQQQAIARRILIRLVQFGEGRPSVRRQQTLGDLRVDDDPRGAFERTLEVLIDHRLVTTGTAPSGEGQVTTVDLAHEALITGWPTLTEWLERTRAAEDRRRRLRQKADDWVALGRATGGLLDEVQLGDAERFLDDEATQHIGVDPGIREHVTASRARVDQRNRRQRAMTIGLIVTTCAALVFAGWATVSQRSATLEANRQRSMLLARLSAAQIDDPGLASLLALEAARRSPTVDARGALLAAVGQQPALMAHLIADRQSLLAVVASPAAGLIATAGSTGRPDVTAPSIQLWDLAEGTHLGELDGGHDDEITALAADPDGTLLASGGRDDRIVLWDLASRTQVGELRPPADEPPVDGPGCRPAAEPDTLGDVRTLAFSPNGTVLASAGHDRRVRLWDVGSGTDSAFDGHACDVLDVAFNPDGSVIASVGRDATLRFWDVASGDELHRVGEIDRSAWDRSGNPDDLRAVAYAPDGALVAVARNDGRVTLVEAGEPWAVQEPVLAHTQRVFDVTFSPDGELLASASRDLTVSIRRVDDAAEVARLGGGARGLAWVADDQLLTVGGDRGIRVWDPTREVAAGRRVTTRPDLVGAIHLGDRILGVGSSGDLEVWRDDGTSSEGALLDEAGEATVVTDLGADRVAVGHGSGYLSVRDAATLRALAVWPAHAAPVTALDHRAATGELVSGDQTGAVRTWDPGSGTRSGAEVRASDCTIRALLAVPEPPIGLALGCNEQHSLRWWVPSDGPTADRVVRQGGRINDLAVTPEGGRLVGATTDGRVALWDIAGTGAWADPSTLTARSEEIQAVVVAPDERIATGSNDGLVQLWDLPTSSSIGPAWRLPRPIVDLSLAPDGTALAVVTGSGLFELGIDEAAWRDDACRLAGRDLDPTEWRQYVDPTTEPVSSCSDTP